MIPPWITGRHQQSFAGSAGPTRLWPAWQRSSGIKSSTTEPRRHKPARRRWGLSRALFSGRLVHHDRGRVLADISCAIADGARAISDFRVLADQAEAFGQVASVPTAYRTLEEITRGGTRTEKTLTAAISAARRHAWAQVVARHGTLPGVRVADKILEGVTCVRLDATVTFAHSGKELAEGNFKGLCDVMPLAVSERVGGGQ